MKKVAVVGAGMMGREIAIVYARAGHQVAIVDATMELAQVAKEKQAGTSSVLPVSCNSGFSFHFHKKSAFWNRKM